jgi:hypothetical protein
MQANLKIMEAEQNQSVDPSSVIAAKAMKDQLVGTQKYQKLIMQMKKFGACFRILLPCT